MDKEQLTIAYERTCLCHNSKFSITTVIGAVVVKLQASIHKGFYNLYYHVIIRSKEISHTL